MTTDIVRTAGWRGLRAPPAGDRRATGGVLNITAAVRTAGFHWWRSGNKKRTQHASEYMLVLAVCLVTLFRQRVPGFGYRHRWICFRWHCRIAAAGPPYNVNSQSRDN